MYTADSYKTKTCNVFFNNISLIYNVTEHIFLEIITTICLVFLCVHFFADDSLMDELYGIHDPLSLGLSKINLHFLDIIFYFISQNGVIKKIPKPTNYIV